MYDRNCTLKKKSLKQSIAIAANNSILLRQYCELQELSGACNRCTYHGKYCI